MYISSIKAAAMNDVAAGGKGDDVVRDVGVGFRTIHVGAEAFFGPQVRKKGHDLFASGHVRNVFEQYQGTGAGLPSKISGTCTPETRVQNPP